MPSSMTHGYFCDDVFNKCNKNVKKKLNDCINYFKVFGQGPDPYFFYDFHLTKKSYDIYNINKAMQHPSLTLFFKNIAIT